MIRPRCDTGGLAAISINGKIETLVEMGIGFQLNALGISRFRHNALGISMRSPWKWKHRNFYGFCVTGCIGRCHFDNL